MSAVRVSRARVAILTRHRGPDDPAVIEARRELAAANLEQFITRTLAAAPPLTAERRAAIAAILFAPSTVGGGESI